MKKIKFIFLLLALYAGASISAESLEVKKFCEKLDERFKTYGWDKSQCEQFDWFHIRNSVLGDPLVWTVFGDTSDEAKPSFKEKDLTIIMCGVHGDEITPIKFCFDILYYFKDLYSNPEAVKKEFKDKIVLIAPLVNPDSFFKKKPTRVNSRGVDVNRNFPTKDWMRDARKYWISKLHKDRRRNPGLSPLSEPEVIFQVNLIKRYRPDKIISVHSPLTMLDYDGPNKVSGIIDGTKAQELLIQMSKDASDYRIENYPFFPGSLGNWAGKERDIPTYTLELPTSDPSKSTEYWRLFKSAMHNAILHDLKNSN
jgi:protein MpaA